MLDFVDEKGAAPRGYKGGKPYKNDGREGGEVLPSSGANGDAITYQEWDINVKLPGIGRGQERLVTGSDGSAYWTDDHYQSFNKIR